MSVDLCQSAELPSPRSRNLLNPDRLHLRRSVHGTTYLILYRQRLIGQVGLSPDSAILLEKPFSEQFCDRIRDLVNKRDGTNRNITVRCAPDRNDPAILKFLSRQRLSW